MLYTVIGLMCLLRGFFLGVICVEWFGNHIKPNLNKVLLVMIFSEIFIIIFFLQAKIDRRG